MYAPHFHVHHLCLANWKQRSTVYSIAKGACRDFWSKVLFFSLVYLLSWIHHINFACPCRVNNFFPHPVKAQNFPCLLYVPYFIALFPPSFCFFWWFLIAHGWDGQASTCWLFSLPCWVKFQWGPTNDEHLNVASRALLFQGSKNLFFFFSKRQKAFSVRIPGEHHMVFSSPVFCSLLSVPLHLSASASASARLPPWNIFRALLCFFHQGLGKDREGGGGGGGGHE